MVIFEVLFMAYFIRKTIRKTKAGSRPYLEMYFSGRVPGKKNPESYPVETLGYVDDLKKKLNVDDPIAYYKEVVKKRNEEEKVKKFETQNNQKIGYSTQLFNIGYFLPYSVLNSLNIRNDLKLMSLTRNFDLDLAEFIFDFTCARIADPCSKKKTYEQVLKSMLLDIDYSENQIYDPIHFIGQNYHKFVEILTAHYKDVGYKLDFNCSLFDGTNFYFEIDKEDDFRRKGPSKENRKEPIVGLGLLLDANGMPADMELYPGSDSEKPVLRNIISDIKARHNIKGRTIQVADKGLNCGDNIYKALKDGDGYIFSASLLSRVASEKTKKNKKAEVKDKEYFRQYALIDNKENPYIEVKNKNGELLYKYKSAVFDNIEYDRNVDGKKEPFLVQKEKRVIIFNPELRRKKLFELERIENKAKDLILSKAKKKEFNSIASYVKFVAYDKNTGEIDSNERVKAALNTEKIKLEKEMAGYNMLVTSELNVSAEQIYSLYHNLWRIEETFRIIKTDLEGRPVHMQTRDGICGHFTICFYSVAIIRLLQLWLLKDEEISDIKSNEIFDFIRKFICVLGDPKKGVYQNISAKTSLLEKLIKFKGLESLDNAYFTKDIFKRFTTYKWEKISTLQK